jgi:hypothetical protein
MEIGRIFYLYSGAAYECGTEEVVVCRWDRASCRLRVLGIIPPALTFLGSNYRRLGQSPLDSHGRPQLSISISESSQRLRHPSPSLGTRKDLESS